MKALPLTILFLIAAYTCIGMLGCTYSFTGGKVEGETFTVKRIDNAANMVVPSLAQDFTEQLRDRFLQQTNLKLVDRNGDLSFSGTITHYDVMPLTVQAGDQASQNRMTLTLSVKFVHKLKPEESWDEQFSNFVDFPASQNAQAESVFLPELVEKIAQDIFNKTLSNW